VGSQARAKLTYFTEDPNERLTRLARLNIGRRMYVNKMLQA
jgi:hypothetical protein